MTELDFNFDSFESGYNTNFDMDCRYIQPRIKTENELDEFVEYKYAEDAAKKIDLSKRTFIIVNGSFIFGDFLEALLIKNAIKCNFLEISTLSLCQNNIDSLAGLMRDGYIDKLSIIGSDFFASHEKYNLMKYIYDVLDIEDRFQLSVARIHTKIIIFETSKGNKFVIHGSANLRSSSNFEQLMIENNPELYDFIRDFDQRIIDKYKTIKHENKNRRMKKWETITE